MHKVIAFTAAALLSLILVQTSVFAQAGGRAFEKKNYSYNEWAKGRFAEVVTVVNTGKWIFLGGIGPEQEVDGKILYKGDFHGQCMYAWQKIKKLLGMHGATFNDIVKTTIYMTDVGQLAELNRIYAEFFPESPPAKTGVEVSHLAIGAKIEIEAIAAAAG